MFKGKDNRHILSINDFSKDDILDLIETTYDMKARPEKFERILKGWKVAEMFYGDSTRTFDSFGQATADLGGVHFGFRNPQGTSVGKRESLVSTGQTYRGYGANVIVVRNPRDGAALYLAEALDADFENGVADKRVWVIDGGTGNKDHSTQNLLDLFTFHEMYGDLNGLKFLVFGDLLYGRSIRFVLPLSLFNDIEITFLSHPKLALAEDIKKTLDGRGVKYEEVFDPDALPDILPNVMFAYGSRNQENRFPATVEGEELKNAVRGFVSIDKKLLSSLSLKKYFKLYHALPVDSEYPCLVKWELDRTKWNGYLRESENGLHTRKVELYKMRHEK